MAKKRRGSVDLSVPRLMVYGITPEAWTKRFGVLAFSAPCSECGRNCTTSIPFAQGELRGLQSPPCECGNTRTPYALVRDPKYGDLLDRT
jgi:hypothetical protein